MMFHTTAFILGFLPVCMAGFFTLGRFCSATWALRWLVACSLFFYAWWNPEHLPLLVGSVWLNHTIARQMGHTDRPRAWMAAGVALNLGILAWFKYADFLLHIVAPHATPLHITLPLAISFFTFQQIMFLVDAAAWIEGRPEPECHGRPEPEVPDEPESWVAEPNPAGIGISRLRRQLWPSRPILTVMAEPKPSGIGMGHLLRQLWPTRPTLAVMAEPKPSGVGVGHLLRKLWPTRPTLTVMAGWHPGHLPPTVRARLAGMHPGMTATRQSASLLNLTLKRMEPAQATTPSHNFPPLLTYAAFVTFFPHLIAGPIVRPSEIIPQLAAANLARPRIENIADGVLIFLLGLGKKLVLADMFGGFADIGFDAAAHGATLTFFEAWYATLSYTLQIYFDFSGYSDMAIGLARMLNIRFPLNFDSPYQATNIAEFWRRWHMTLGGFLRDYLYIPLGGNRAGPLRQTVNLMATMLLCGLWHGAAWNFVIWGGLHGLLIVIHKQYRRIFRPLPPRFAQAVTLFVVILAWVPFRATSLSSTMAMLGGMAGLNGIALPRMIVSAWQPLAAFIDPVSVMPFLGDARTLSFPEISACLLLGWLIVLTLPNIHRMTIRARQWTLTGSFALSMQALFFAPHVAPFLYFQF